MLDLLATWKSLSAAGLPFFLFLAAFANQRGWWVWKRDLDIRDLRITELKEDYALLKAENDKWKELVLYGHEVTRQAAGLLKT